MRLIDICRTFFTVSLLSYTLSSKECQNKAHRSLNAQEKQTLCENSDFGSPLGPALCSIAAKDSLRLKSSDIVFLCSGAGSTAPADCMSKLDPSTRGRIGVQLCSAALSTLPADCYHNLTYIKLSSLHGSKQAVSDQIVGFCSVLEDRMPYICARQVLQSTSLPLEKTLLICQDSIENEFTMQAIPHCIESMSKHVSASLPVDKVVKFCVDINPKVYHNIISEENIHAAVQCYNQSQSLLPRFQSMQRMGLCNNAPLPLGPLNCSLLLMQDPSEKPKTDDLVSLCQGATSGGPATCYIESKGLGDVQERIKLCNAAKSADPAHCYRRAGGLFRGDGESRLLLCVGSVSEAPAMCASSAPQYLSNEEKVHLCQHSSPHNYQEGAKCLQALQSLSPRYAQAPKRGLGYSLESLASAQDRVSRALLLQLCAFSDSSDPMASAECFKSVPTSISHDQAALMCRDISSSEVIDSLLFCYRLLPPLWTTPPPSPRNISSPSSPPLPLLPPAHLLCDKLATRAEVENAVRCAVEGGKVLPPPSSSSPPFSLYDLAPLCQTERSKSLDVLNCLKIALFVTKGTGAGAAAGGGGGYFPPLSPPSIYKICSHAQDNNNAQCLSYLSTWGAGKGVGISSEVVEYLCASPPVSPPRVHDLPGYLSCFQALSPIRRFISEREVGECNASPRSIAKVVAKGVLDELNGGAEQGGKEGRGGGYVTANQRFHLFFDVYDQFDQVYQGGGGETLHLSLLPSPQGAVLWGMTKNTTSSKGLLVYHNLLLSQPGPVEMKIYSLSIGGKKKLVGGVKLVVHPHPIWGDLSPCLYIFHQAVCHVEDSPADHERVFPMTNAFYPAHNYLSHLSCQDKLPLWDVKAHLSPSLHLFVEYRGGLEAIWGGINMIRGEMSPWERLGLRESEVVHYNQSFYNTSSNSHAATGSSTNSRSSKSKSKSEADYMKGLLKIIKRAYYRSSLFWHPDRWTAYTQYNLVVRGVFQLIAEAYEELERGYGERLKEIEGEKEKIIVEEIFE